MALNSGGKKKSVVRRKDPLQTDPHPLVSSLNGDEDSKVDIDIRALPDIKRQDSSQPQPVRKLSAEERQLSSMQNTVVDAPVETPVKEPFIEDAEIIEDPSEIKLPQKIVRRTDPVTSDGYEERNIPWPKPVKLGTGPLSGIRILDLTRLYPGPLATMMMADMGADVIKIEDIISPDYMRDYPPYVNDLSAGYMAVNRSKRSLALRLSEERGQEVFFDLVKTADIVVEQFKPGVLQKIGLDYVEAIKTNPRVIYVSLTGYGQSGPYAQNTGHDVNYLGLSGILSNTINDRGEPVVPGAQITDVAGAYMAMNACMAALLARDRTGQGQRVDVSLLDAALPMMSLPLAHYWSTGEKLPPSQQPLTRGMAAYGTYRCKDGKYVALGAVEPKFWTRFCELAGKPKWLDKMNSSGREATKLRKEIVSLFKGKPRDYWLDQIGAGDYCLTPVLDVEDIEDDPHIKSRGMVDVREHPQFGKVKTIGIPLKFSHTHPRISNTAPNLGEHTAEVLMELGYSEGKIDELRRLGIVVKLK
ncbi:MAG: CaiB/BaiF CoA transferase family protein [Calditrichia bacterium]